MSAREITIKNIGNKVAKVLSRSIEVDQLILFGSYAYGRPREDSDFDIAVISNDLGRIGILERIGLFSKAALEIDRRVELKGFDKKEFQKAEKGSMAEFIKRKGKVIYRPKPA